MCELTDDGEPSRLDGCMHGIQHHLAAVQSFKRRCGHLKQDVRAKPSANPTIL